MERARIGGNEGKGGERLSGAGSLPDYTVIAILFKLPLRIDGSPFALFSSSSLSIKLRSRIARSNQLLL